VSNSYSYSQLNQFRGCPRKYKFQYIERAVVERPVSVELFMGSKVHQALERLYNLKVHNQIQSRDEMLDFYHSQWEGPDKAKIKVVREYLAVDDYIKIGADSLGKYYDMYYPFDEGEILGLEKNINFPVDKDSRFIIRGKIDKIVKRDDGQVDIVDYKTGREVQSQPKLDNDLQMGLYQIGLNYIWPMFDKIELKQVYLRQGIEMKTIMPPDKIDEIRYDTYQKILEIENARREDNFPPKESALCDWCVFYELCPAKRHRLKIDDQVTDEIDPGVGRDLVDRYLEKDRQKKLLDVELKALKDDIVGFCEKADLSRLDSDSGHVSVKISESGAFPSKTADEKAFAELSFLVREAGLVECFKLDIGTLYKEFFIKEKLPADLTERLRQYIIRKKKAQVFPKHKTENSDQEN
jgi:hypothetical protein